MYDLPLLKKTTTTKKTQTLKTCFHSLHCLFGGITQHQEEAEQTQLCAVVADNQLITETSLNHSHTAAAVLYFNNSDSLRKAPNQIQISLNSF